MYTSKVKIAFGFILYFSFSINLSAMQSPDKSALDTYRKKSQAEFFPNVTVPNDQDWHIVMHCFSELLKLELSSPESKITFKDAKQYCEYARMLQVQEYFDAYYVATIKRFTNLIMFAVFYPAGSGSPYFGPSSDSAAQVVAHRYRTILQNPEDMNAIFSTQSPDFAEIDNRLKLLITAVRNFKTNPPRRNKLESNQNKE